MDLTIRPYKTLTHKHNVHTHARTHTHTSQVNAQRKANPNVCSLWNSQAIQDWAKAKPSWVYSNALGHHRCCSSFTAICVCTQVLPPLESVTVCLLQPEHPPSRALHFGSFRQSTPQGSV